MYCAFSFERGVYPLVTVSIIEIALLFKEEGK